MNLTKTLFIRKVLSRFPYFVEKDEENSYYDTYSRVLTHKVNYDKLFDIFAQEYDEKSPPSGKWLKDKAKLCYLDASCSGQKYRCVKVFDPRLNGKTEICFEGNPSDEAILKTLDERFPGFKGWKVL